MIVNATASLKVDINPKEVIQQLIEKELPIGSWIEKMGGKIYIGNDSCDKTDFKEISVEKLEYINSLQKVLNHLTL